jgi:hypothetical protein
MNPDDPEFIEQLKRGMEAVFRAQRELSQQERLEAMANAPLPMTPPRWWRAHHALLFAAPFLHALEACALGAIAVRLWWPH